ncbi:MAG: cyclic nucleotide-binding domain-containing protein, partial [Myxococcales bacterium]|nr:cyclic nucleotide-binding domain-containing protein [Myxococcales bacterium]
AALDAALRAAGGARAAGLVPSLVEMLSDRRCRPRAAEALRDIGQPSMEQLSALAMDDGASVDARIAAVRVLGSGDATRGKHLLALLDAEDPRLSYAALRALVRLRSRTGDLAVDAEQVNTRVRAALDDIYANLLALELGSWPEVQSAETPAGLLERTLMEDAGEQLDRAFSLLSLTHDIDDLRAARKGATSPLKSTRASSIEFLDNVLDKTVKQPLLPLLESADAGQFEAAAGREGVQKETREGTLGRLLESGNPWLRSVACWTVGTELTESLGERVKALADGDDDTAAVAKLAVEALAKGSALEARKMGLTVIEKALKLQTVDVLQRASSEDLGHVAQIAQEVELSPGTEIYAEGDSADALFVVISGSVKLLRGKDEIGTVREGEAFGTWALFDEAPRVATAKANEDTLLLKVDRDEFLELLADRVDIVQAVFRAMVSRLRQLADVVQSSI